MLQSNWFSLDTRNDEEEFEQLKHSTLLHNPKQGTTKSGKSCWYNYYAGYSEQFVHDIFQKFSLSSDQVVLDPWNGAGTTTQIANDIGIVSYGYDINPVMTIVAKARLLDPSVKQSLKSIGSDILCKANNKCSISNMHNAESLQTWFTNRTAMHLRRIELSIQRLLIDDRLYRIIFCESSLDFLSSLSSFFYVALFQTVRELLVPFRSSNPTWIRIPKESEALLDIDNSIIDALFVMQINRMTDTLNYNEVEYNSPGYNSTINIGSSTAIPLTDHSVQAVISSPPYCTRIDYAIATRPELAILGCSIGDDIRELRSHMIGTPTISKEILTVKKEWGSICQEFLIAVENHTAKASKSYYLKTFLQYFNSIFISFCEINRVLRNGGMCALVVQDSYYKEVHNDLPGIFCEFANYFDWTTISRHDFKVSHSMASVNHHSKKYRKGNGTTESALIFYKP